jgi:hypothetical protein
MGGRSGRDASGDQGIYAATVFGWGAAELGLFGIILTITGTIGAALGGPLDDRAGSKAVIAATLCLFIAASIGVLSVDRDHVLFVLPVEAKAPGSAPFSSAGEQVYLAFAILIGLASGPIQASSRTLLAGMCPPGKTTEFFGFFSFSGKITAFAAPLVIGAVTHRRRISARRRHSRRQSSRYSRCARHEPRWTHSDLSNCDPAWASDCMAAARERRSSSTSGLRPFSARKALTAARAACGFSGCTGRAAYSGDTNVKEHPPNGFHKHGIRNSATAGVATRLSIAIMMPSRIIPVTRLPSVRLTILAASGCGAPE